MSTVAKILVVLNLVLAGFFLASASNFLGKQDNYFKRLTEERAAHDLTRSEKDSRITELGGQVAALSNDLNKVREERSVSQAESARLEQALTHTREAYDQLAENSTRAQRAVDQLTNSLNATRALNDALTKNNQQLQQALAAANEDRDAKVAMVNSLQQQLRNETEKSKDLEAKLATANEEIERKDFRLAWWSKRFPGAEAGDQPAHTGRVLAANGNANVFVISLGEEDGVKPGYQYIVARGSKYIATIQIDDVQAKQSSGFALKDLSKGQAQAGDTVVSGR
jgi:chromosome segregation ATPase